MLTKNVPPADAVADAQRIATQRIEAYNQRAGG
jgi:hypothetical protein